MTSIRITPKHTPGPYFYRRSTDGCDDTWDIVATCDGRVITSLCFWDGDDDKKSLEQTEANAKLFAAAPVLYEVLDALVTHAMDPESDLADYDVIRTLDRATAILAAIRGDQS
jgi:hypothetical protein